MSLTGVKDAEILQEIGQTPLMKLKRSDFHRFINWQKTL